VLLILLLGGCSKNIQNEEAVRTAVIEYLNARAPQTGLDMNAMTVEVATMSFERDSARVTVSVTPKGLTGAGMQINYDLDRKGDKWVVRPNASPHITVAPSGSQSLPPGHPAAPGDSQALPPGHPAVAPDGSQGLPPGHPPIAKQ
jgi:hypothetical protein